MNTDGVTVEPTEGPTALNAPSPPARDAMSDLVRDDTAVAAPPPRLAGPAASRVKRVVDTTLAFFALVFMLPLFLVVAFAVVADSQGPVFFVQRRTGLHGRAISVFKFRTMSVMENGAVIAQAAKGDRRVTRVGAFLRRSSIDELPQLLNVLRGEMSLVGPRPHALAHDQYYGALVPGYTHRFRARPGITGLAQITGFRGEIHSLDCMEGRVAADNRYIDTWSFWLDIGILLKTLVIAPFQDSAY